MSAPRTDDHRWPCRTHPKRTLLEGGHEALFSRCSRMAARMAATRWWTRPAARPSGHRADMTWRGAVERLGADGCADGGDSVVDAAGRPTVGASCGHDVARSG